MAASKPRSANVVRRILVDRFPDCFAPKNHDKRPLALGISYRVRKDCPDLTWREIRRAIGDYVNGPRYKRNMIAGAPRIGLAGQPCGVVSQAHAEDAAKRLVEFGWTIEGPIRTTKLESREGSDRPAAPGRTAFGHESAASHVASEIAAPTKQRHPFPIARTPASDAADSRAAVAGADPSAAEHSEGAV